MRSAARSDGGRAATLEDGWIVLHGATKRPRRLVEAAELPVTFAGLSRYNIANALAGAGGCDALGLTTRRIEAGLRIVRGGPRAPTRAVSTSSSATGVFALVDFAHNEAGLPGLLDVARAVAGRHRVRLATARRATGPMRSCATWASWPRGADDLVIAEKRHYLRGRDLDEMNRILRAGVREGGFSGEGRGAPERAGRAPGADRASRAGDVCAVMAHVERSRDRRLAEVRRLPTGRRSSRLRELLGLIAS